MNYGTVPTGTVLFSKKSPHRNCIKFIAKMRLDTVISQNAQKRISFLVYLRIAKVKKLEYN